MFSAELRLNTHTRGIPEVWYNAFSEIVNNNAFFVQHLCFKELRGEVWQYSSKLMCFLNGLLLGNEKDLCSWAKTKWDFTFSQPEDFYTALTQEYYTKHLQNTGASKSNLSNKQCQSMY